MNQSEFQRKISSSQKPIVIDFWAPWCAPCRVTKPVLEKLAREFEGRVEFVPVNADESQEVLQALKVYGIPTVITFRNGMEAGRVVGARAEPGFRALFEALATGEEVNIPLTQFDRMLRLGSGGLLIALGVSTSNWLVAGIGALIVFMGIYDRCPIWRAITGYFKR
jgi:thioredoxin